MNGFLLINKPVGPTSHDIVDEVRRIFHTRKVGHAGTLDPFASGLLIIGVGSATKKLSQFQKLPKRYTGVIKLGAISTTDDSEGSITQSYKTLPKEQEVSEVLKKFIGEIMQIPPAFSAKKIKGKKFYELARAGEETPRTPVPVTIYKLLLKSYQDGEIEFKTFVSSGTYIRALARDIGEGLDVGGYLKKLERTAIGSCELEEAVNIAKLRENPPKYLIQKLNCATLISD